MRPSNRKVFLVVGAGAFIAGVPSALARLASAATDVSNLDNLAAAISGSGSTRIRNYAIAQAAATQSQETDIQKALTETAALDARIDALGSGGGGSSSDLVHPTIRRVQGSGSDSSSGASWTSAKATLQAAYDALPANGGWVEVGPAVNANSGYNVGAGVQLQNSKPAVFRSALGPRHQRAPISAYVTSGLSWAPRIYTTNTSAAELFRCSGGNGQGFGWQGLVFDVSQTGLRQAIYAPNVSYSLLDDCAATGPETYVQDRYMVRGLVTAGGDDSSWWNMTNNGVRRMGLCDMGTTGGENNNRHYIAGNRLLGASGEAGTGMKFEFPAGVTTWGNNIEGYQYGIWMHAAVSCGFYGDAGETTTNFIYATSAYGCDFSPLGISNVSGHKLVTILGGDNVITASPLRGGTQYPADPSRTGAVDGGPGKYTMLWPTTLFDSP